jgi:glutathione S-transferase
MKLYYAQGACSLAPHILLRELGKKFEIEKVDLASKKTESGKDYTRINAKGYVPTLETKPGETLTEVAVILQYLADKAKATKLLPKPGTTPRYRAMEMLNFISAELHKSFGALFNKALPEDGRKIFLERIETRLGWLDQVLAKNKFLLGKSFSVADIYAFVVLNWGGWLNVDIRKWKHVAEWFDRIAARPSVKAALKAEGLAS